MILKFREIGFAVILFLVVIFVNDVSTETTTENEGKQRVICYYYNSARFFKPPMKFNPEDIPATLCDDIVYHEAYFDHPWELQYRFFDRDLPIGAMDRVTALRSNTTSVLLAVAGRNQVFSDLSSKDNRDSFVASVVEFLLKYKFDGLLLNWKYAGEGHNGSLEKTTYVELVKDLRMAFDPYRFKLAISSPRTIRETNKGYDIAELTKYVDQIHVLSSWFFGYWNKKALSHSPLKSVGEYENASVSMLMDHWINKGADKHKLYVGITYTSAQATLKANTSGKIGSPAEGPGPKSNYTNGLVGQIAYYEVCRNLMSGTWTEHWDQDGMMPYAYNTSQPRLWASYENSRSAYEKAKYAKQRGFGGIFIFNLHNDDLRGLCGPKFTLTKALRKGLY